MKYFILIMLLMSTISLADPIRLIVPNGPAGALDYAARIIQKSWPGNVVVDNREGASGKIALSILQKANDNTIAIISATHVIDNPNLIKFQAVSKIGYRPFVIITHPSVKQFNNLRYSTTGVNSYQHLILNKLNIEQKLNMLHVPFNGGGAMINSLLTGESQIAITSLTPLVVELSSANKIKIVAITSETRSLNYPTIPTTKEVGINMTFSSWLGIITSPGSNQTEIFNSKLKFALSDRQLIDSFNKQDFTIRPSTPYEFKKFLIDESSKLSKMKVYVK